MYRKRFSWCHSLPSPPSLRFPHLMLSPFNARPSLKLLTTQLELLFWTWQSLPVPQVRPRHLKSGKQKRISSMWKERPSEPPTSIFWVLKWDWNLNRGSSTHLSSIKVWPTSDPPLSGTQSHPTKSSGMLLELCNIFLRSQASPDSHHCCCTSPTPAMFSFSQHEIPGKFSF